MRATIRNIHNLKHDIMSYREICNNNIATFGREHEITKSHIRELNRLIALLKTYRKANKS